MIVTRYRTALVGVGLLVVCLGLCFVGTLLASPSKSRVYLGDLLMDVTCLPADWHLVNGPEILPAKLDHGAAENFEVIFKQGVQFGGVRQVFYRFNNVLFAMFEYDTVRAGLFYDSSSASAWTTPKTWTYTSPLADQFEFACREEDAPKAALPLKRMTNCKSSARYGSYITELDFTLVPGNLTVKDVEGCLRLIDAKMVHYLK